MLLVKIKNKKMRNYILPIITAVVIFSSCGGEKTASLSDLKLQQAELKTQLAESEKNINNESDAFKNYALQAKLQPEIEKLEQQLKTQTGGQKYKQKHKKYDIKWT